MYTVRIQHELNIISQFDVKENLLIVVYHTHRSKFVSHVTYVRTYKKCALRRVHQVQERGMNHKKQKSQTFHYKIFRFQISKFSDFKNFRFQISKISDFGFQNCHISKFSETNLKKCSRQKYQNQLFCFVFHVNNILDRNFKEIWFWALFRL